MSPRRCGPGFGGRCRGSRLRSVILVAALAAALMLVASTAYATDTSATVTLDFDLASMTVQHTTQARLGILGNGAASGFVVPPSTPVVVPITSAGFAPGEVTPNGPGGFSYSIPFSLAPRDVSWSWRAIAGPALMPLGPSRFQIMYTYSEDGRSFSGPFTLKVVFPVGTMPVDLNCWASSSSVASARRAEFINGRWVYSYTFPYLSGIWNFHGEFIVDSEPPVVVHDLLGAQSGGWFREPVDLDLSALDAPAGGPSAGVDRIEYAVNGGDTIAVPGSVVADSFAEEGIYTLRYRAIDRAGNASAWVGPVVWRVDQTVPHTWVTGNAMEHHPTGDLRRVTLAAMDPQVPDITGGGMVCGSGVPAGSTVYSIDGGVVLPYPAEGIVIPDAGFHVLRFHSVDLAGNHEPDVVATMVVPANAAPSVSAATVPLLEHETANSVLQGSDPNGDPLTFDILSGPTGGACVQDPPGVLIYSPTGHFAGSDPVVVEAVDEHGAHSRPAIVTFVVEPVNDPPVAAAGVATTFRDLPVDITLVGSDPKGDPVTFSVTAPPASGDVAVAGSVARYTPAAGFVGTDTFVVRASDGSAFSDPVLETVIVLPPPNSPPSILGVVGPSGPVAIGAAAGVSVRFSDPDDGDAHVAQFTWGDGSTSTGDVDQAADSAAGSHAYTVPGVYRVTATVTDRAGEGASGTHEFVVVFDPDGGFVTGGGWVLSPAGAYLADPALTGRASFGFVARYLRGANVPTGNTEFQFHAGGFAFKSTAYDWLVVAGSKAQFKGIGTVNGSGLYGFMLTCIDGAPDTFRMKVWRVADGAIVYDSGLGVDDGAAPFTPLGGGAVVIHPAR